MRLLYIFTIIFILSLATLAQKTEILTNREIILMSQAGLSKDLIVRKIRETEGRYETSAENLIELKKAGVADEVIRLLMDLESETGRESDNKNYSDSDDNPSVNPPPFGYISNQTDPDDTARIVLGPKEALSQARTIAIKKSSLHPSRQALEKELLKRRDWQELNLNIVRYKNDADLLIEIGYVSMSWLTHRYTFRVFDNKSGTVIVAGETTSWGSLAENLARGIAKRLNRAMKESGK